MHMSGKIQNPPPTNRGFGGTLPDKQPPGTHPIQPQILINNTTTVSIQPGRTGAAPLPTHFSGPPLVPIRVPAFVQTGVGPLPCIHAMPMGMPPGSAWMGYPHPTFAAPMGSAIPPHASSHTRPVQPRYARQRLPPTTFVNQKLFTHGVSYPVAEAMATIDDLSANPVDFSERSYKALVNSVRDIIGSSEASEDKESAICLVNEANAIVYRWNQARAQGRKLPLFYFAQSDDNQRAPDAFAGRKLFTTVKVTLEVVQAMQTIAQWSPPVNQDYSPARYATLAGAIKTIRDFPNRFDGPTAFDSASQLLDIANGVVRQWRLANPGISLPLLSFDNAKVELKLTSDVASLSSASTVSTSTVSASQVPEASQVNLDDLVSKHWPTQAQVQRFNGDPQDAASADSATHQHIVSLPIEPRSETPVLRNSEPLQPEPSPEKKRPAAALENPQPSMPAKRRATASAVGKGPSTVVSASMPTMESPPPETVRLRLPAHELSMPFPVPIDLQPALQQLTDVLSETGVYIHPEARKRQTDGVYQAFRALAIATLRQGRRDIYDLAAAWTVQWVNDVNLATTQLLHTRQPGLIHTAREAGLLNEEIQRLLASA